MPTFDYRMSRRVLVLIALCVSGSALAQPMDLQGVLLNDEDWRLVSRGHEFTDGLAVDAEGNVFFTDVPNSLIHKIDLAGKVSLFVDNTHQTGGLMFGPDGLLYGCQNGKRRIVAFDENGQTTTIAEDVSADDLVVLGDGGTYFTDPSHGQVGYISPAGKKRVVAKNLRPHGIIAWPDGGTIAVTDRRKPHLWAFSIQPDGGLTHQADFFGPLRLESGRRSPGSAGMTVDSDGRIYVATHAGVQMLDPAGLLGGVIVKPQRAFLSNVVFGGLKLDMMYVTCNDKVYRRRTKCHGVRYGAQPPIARQQDHRVER